MCLLLVFIKLKLALNLFNQIRLNVSSQYLLRMADVKVQTGKMCFEAGVKHHATFHVTVHKVYPDLAAPPRYREQPAIP